MAKPKRRRSGEARENTAESREGVPVDRALPRSYRRASALIAEAKYEQARRMLSTLASSAPDAWLRALASNDLASLDAMMGKHDEACIGFERALSIDPGCTPARLNLDLLASDRHAGCGQPNSQGARDGSANEVAPIRVAIVSMLFNWPSTGGGTVHTFELARFLQDAGYEVLHIYVRFEPWGIGRVEGRLPYPSAALDFSEHAWSLAEVQTRVRAAVDAFTPDYVLITDSWNSKPLLAEAVHGYSYILRFQALECFCPLNNVRLLSDGAGGFGQCDQNQLSTPQACTRCLERNGGFSGPLHQAERTFCGVGTDEYHERLMRAIGEAEAVLVVNPLTADLVRPYARDVRVVTAGMDPARFPWPPAEPPRSTSPGRRTRLLFAGLIDEPMKGFAVLHAACELLWRHRRDFELWATADPPGPYDEYTQFVGWQTQEALPRTLEASDILVMPTIAQEALGRTTVEAMAAGRPVVASRLGGLPFTVLDGETGLLCQPGDPVDLARLIEKLLDDEELRKRMGTAGRRRFEEHYAWPVIIEQHYRPLLSRKHSPIVHRPPVPMGHDTRPAVQIVGPTDRWILQALARRLASKLPYAEFVPWHPRPSSDALIYYVNYALFDRPSGCVDVGFFTHEEDGHGFLERARRVDHCISMSKRYADWLREQGVSHVTHIPMGFDAHRFRPRLVLGVVGRLDQPRKGREMIDRLKRLDFVDLVLTEGRLEEHELRQVYERIDYALIPATVEGGPMSLLEALGCGRPVIAPADVGIVPELETSAHVRLYPAGNAQALEQLVVECHREKLERRQLVASRSWDEWARAHHELFARLLGAKGIALPTPAPEFRFGLMEEMTIPLNAETGPLEDAVDLASRELYFGRTREARGILEAIRPRYPCVDALLSSC